MDQVPMPSAQALAQNSSAARSGAGVESLMTFAVLVANHSGDDVVAYRKVGPLSPWGLCKVAKLTKHLKDNSGLQRDMHHAEVQHVLVKSREVLTHAAIKP